MTSIARRIVSGQKARFKDPVLDLDLDLTYVTDHSIIMGFPSAGVQSLYRNKRSDVRRFLDKRHHDLYRIYNLCPLTENSYDADEFYGRVSRYPFPDHHAPPLSLIPLFVADITEYLESHPHATAVIHSKAGNGRSGTMTCCYLVSLPYLPTPPTTINNYSNIKTPHTQSTPNLLPNAAAPTNRTQHTYHTLGNGAASSQLVLPKQQTRSSAAKPASSSINLELPRSAAWTNATSVDSALPLPLLRRKPSLNPEQSIIRNNDSDPDYEIEQISHRLQTIFDLHTQRRMKPPPATPARKSRKSGHGHGHGGTNMAGLRALAHSTRAMPSAAASTVSLGALGAAPAGRSCDAFQLSTHHHHSSTHELHSNFETPTTAADEAAIEHSSDKDDDEADSVAVIQNTEDHSDTKQPNMGVSIPSQRRWVAYWTRMLAGRDARLHMTSTLRQPRRQILITRITLERRASASKSAQRWFERLVPHSDALSIQLVRYQDTLVDRLESWERHARRRAKAFGNHDPSALARDLDENQQQQKQRLKTLRRQASDLVCWDGNKFDKQHEEKIGNWGVCVKAEAERARSFKWNDDGPQLDYFAIIRESSPREVIDNGKQKLCKYTFEPRGDEGGKRHSDASSGDSGYHSSNTGTGGASGANHTHLAPPIPATPATAAANTDDGPFVRKLTRKASSIFRTASLSSCSDVTPSSTAYLAQRIPATTDTGLESVVGQVVDADRELCVKVLVGRTGSKHSKLPDVASAGWCWFIPSFEDPQAGAPAMATVGSRTKIRFDSHQIDFRKDPIGLVAIEVEWQWVSTGIDEDEDEDEGMDPDERNRW